MAQMIPYILPLLLGRTFDLNKMQIGVDIFPKEALDRRLIIRNPMTETHYKIVDSAVEARDFINVEGSFSLNVKSGIFKLGAAGEYLSDNYNRQNTVEVAVKATYQTATEQLPDDVKPIPTWKTFGSALGTHYVRSITYGGELIASVRFECNNTRDKQKIKGALDVGGKIDIFDVDVQVEGEYMKEASKSIESTQIKIFSSIPLTKPPNDMESLKKTLDEFPNDLEVFNKGSENFNNSIRGIPLKMELWPLQVLDSSRPQQLRNRVLEAYLDVFEQKFDDLLNTKAAIRDWMEAMVKPLTEEQEQKIGNFYTSLQNILKVFYKVIGTLDMSQGTDQLKEAEDAYGNGIPGIYYKKYLELRQEMAEDQGGWTYSRGNGVTYVHWGKSNCSQVAEHLSHGIVVGPEGFGGGANYLCLPSSPELGDKVIDVKDASVVQGVSFSFPGEQASQLLCSTCRLGAKGSVQVFSGRRSCPNEWDYIYDGLLMSGSNNAMSTKFVCLDKNAEKKTKSISENPIIPNWAILVGKEDQKDEENRLLFPCVVCAK